MRLPRFLRGHEWYHGDQRVPRIEDIPEGAAFYRLDCDCGCGRSIDGAGVRALHDPPRWLRRSLGFE